MKPFYLILLAGLVLRISLVNIPGFKFDIDVWAAWALRVSELGFANFYSDIVWTNYTPGYIYILYVLGTINKLLNLSSEAFYFLLKLPPIFSELILAALVFKIIKEKFSFYFAALATSLIIFNPSFIFNSAVWGQIDGLLTLFLVLSVYYLTKNKFILSSLTLSLAILIKPQALFLLPIFIVFILKKFEIKNILKLVIPGSLMILILSLPFFPTKPFTGFLELVTKMANDYPKTSLFAYNLWGFLGFWIDDQQKFLSLTYQQAGIILLLIFLLTFILLGLKRNINSFILASLILLGFYFLPTRVHERYLYPALLFLILSAFYTRSKVLLTLTIFLSFIHFLNLYYVYIYYNEIYLNLPKTLYQFDLYNFLDRSGKILSGVSFITFLAISYKLFKTYASKNKN